MERLELGKNKFDGEPRTLNCHVLRRKIRMNPTTWWDSCSKTFITASEPELLQLAERRRRSIRSAKLLVSNAHDAWAVLNYCAFVVQNVPGKLKSISIWLMSSIPATRHLAENNAQL